jgi:hypothetical protein
LTERLGNSPEERDVNLTERTNSTSARIRPMWAYRGPDDDWRVLRDPHGPATPRQLARPEQDGLLPAGRTLSKLEAARLIDDAMNHEAAA